MVTTYMKEMDTKKGEAWSEQMERNIYQQIGNLHGL